MDVRGVVLYGFGQDGVDEADDRRIVVTVQQVRGLLKLLSDPVEIDLVVETADHLHRILASLLVGLLQQRIEDFVGHAGQVERDAGESACLRKAYR